MSQEPAVDLDTEPQTENPIEEVRKLMESSQTEAEWNANCDKVKSAHGGYPPFWFKEIIQSGLAGRVADRWRGNADIRSQPVTAAPESAPIEDQDATETVTQ